MLVRRFCSFRKMSVSRMQNTVLLQRLLLSGRLLRRTSPAAAAAAAANHFVFRYSVGQQRNLVFVATQALLEQRKIKVPAMGDSITEVRMWQCVCCEDYCIKIAGTVRSQFRVIALLLFRTGHHCRMDGASGTSSKDG